jgi:hypothetical protein
MLRASTRENGMRVWVLAMVAACVVLAGCGDKPVPPFASAPFSVARKGNVLSIPFTVGPFTEFRYRYMLAFKFKRPETDDPMKLLWSSRPAKPLRLRVKLVRIDRGREQLVKINDHRSSFYDREKHMRCWPDDMEARRSDIAEVSMQNHSGGEARMEVVNFDIPDKGFYRFDIETLDDMPMFEQVVSWLTVEREYRHGK